MKNYLVKISPKRWSDTLLDGCVFMRSLHNFGVWTLTNPSNTDISGLKQGIQADVGEGVIFRVDPKKGDDYFNRFSPAVRSMMQDCMYIDEEYIKYLKGYCMYTLDYIAESNSFVKPDPRLKEFGDSAVIIKDEDVFIKRLVEKLGELYNNNFVVKAKRIDYYSPNYVGPLNEFANRESYRWQNEFRICLGIYMEESNKMRSLVRDITPITVDIGNIRDIAVQIPIDDLLSLKLPKEICTL